MTSTRPSVSVVIPTHNRRLSLALTLDSIGRQTVSPEIFEVIVIADGCQDGTQEMLSQYRAGYRLAIISQAGLGSSAARNAGAAQATGELIIFLDDDIRASPGLIESHFKAHQKNPDSAVIGYYPPRSDDQPGLFRIALYTWWEKMFDQMRQAGHRFSCTEILSGNFSISAETFRRLNGFDPALEVHEDYEFGMRLIKENIPIIFEPEALGYHYQATDIKGSLSRKFQEGKADVILGRLHPELRSTLLMYKLIQFPGLYNNLLGTLAFHLAFLGDVMAKMLYVGLGVLEWLRLRWFWRRLLDGLMAYWYWRGVARHLRSLDEVKRYLEEPGPPQTGPDIDLDLAEGLEAAEQLLDRARPTCAAIHYGPHLVGWIPPRPGAECLRGVHLRRILAVELLPALRRALIQAGAADVFGSK